MIRNKAIGGLQATEAPPRQTQIQEQMNKLETVAEDLENYVKELEGRLTPVLLPSKPEEGATGIEKGPVAPLADKLEALCSQLRMVSNELQNVLERLEL